MYRGKKKGGGGEFSESRGSLVAEESFEKIRNKIKTKQKKQKKKKKKNAIEIGLSARIRLTPCLDWHVKQSSIVLIIDFFFSFLSIHLHNWEGGGMCGGGKKIHALIVFEIFAL